MVKFVYIDETGPVGTSLKKQPRLELAAVIVPEDQVMPLADALRALTSKHLGWIPDGFEWHGRDIWNGKGHWSGKGPPELLAAYEGAIALLDEFDLAVAKATIDKPKLHDRHGGTADKNAYRLALQFLLEKVDRNVAGLKLVVADEAKQEQAHAQDMVRDMQQWTWGGEVPGRKLTTVIDSLHFVRSEANPGVQLADLVAYLLFRQRRGGEPHEQGQAARDRMCSIIEDRLATWRRPWPT